MPLLTRQEHLKQLQEVEYDVLVIGGGATGEKINVHGILFEIDCAIFTKIYTNCFVSS